MAFARLRWMTLCPSLPQSFSCYIDLHGNAKEQHQQTPTIYCFEFKFPWPVVVTSPSAKNRRQGTLPMSQIDRAFVAHLPGGLKGQSWGYIHLMETVEYASTCPRKNLEDCAALLNLGDNGSKWQKTGIWSQVSSGRMVIIMYAYIN